MVVLCIKFWDTVALNFGEQTKACAVLAWCEQEAGKKGVWERRCRCYGCFATSLPKLISYLSILGQRDYYYKLKKNVHCMFSKIFVSNSNNHLRYIFQSNMLKLAASV